ncbi:hypothetical protein HDU76_008239 [Blyttiomyces sp. JEL0837]|nr:hypothetical protein HDU76_008239 [Blyttiomyces sp. JEL0837]
MNMKNHKLQFEIVNLDFVAEAFCKKKNSLGTLSDSSQKSDRMASLVTGSARSFARIVQSAMDAIAPPLLAESWDNVGMLIEAPFPRANAKKVFLTIDLTGEVLDEASKDPSVGAIIAYHPPIFRPLKRLEMKNEKEAIVLKSAALGISVLSPHTALDSCVGGINDWLASGLGAGLVSPITPSNVREGSGSGRITTLSTPIAMRQVVDRIKKHLNLKFVRIAVPQGKSVENHLVRTVAICAGSGSSVLAGVDADLFFTGEMSHHEVLAAIASGVGVVLCEHTNTERGYLKLFAGKLREIVKQDIRDFQAICSTLDKDPLQVI